jgi:hypothetical protein
LCGLVNKDDLDDADADNDLGAATAVAAADDALY